MISSESRRDVYKRQPNNCGNKHAAPTCIKRRDVSALVSDIFGLHMISANKNANKQPKMCIRDSQYL